jgi:hypothetical protein
MTATEITGLTGKERDAETGLDDCDAMVKIVIPSQNQLLQPHDRAVRGYRQSPAWAGVWPSNARVMAEDKSVRLGEPVTVAHVPASWNKGTDSEPPNTTLEGT